MSRTSACWRLSPECVLRASGSTLIDAIRCVFRAFEIPDDAPLPRELVIDLAIDETNAHRLVVDGVPVLAIEPRADLAPILEAMIVGFAVRTRSDAAAFHAAAVSRGDHAVLLVGEKGSGKSTLALALAEAGARYLGDEVAFVGFEHPPSVFAFPKAASLKSGSFHICSDARSHEDPIRGAVRYRLPRDIGSPFGAALPIGAIVMPRHSPHSCPARVTSIRPEEAAIVLVKQCFGGLERDPRTLDLIARLTMLPTFRVEFADAESACIPLNGIIEP